jgi:hypothetical protein
MNPGTRTFFFNQRGDGRGRCDYLEPGSSPVRSKVERMEQPS